MPRPTLENPLFRFMTTEDANAFREEIAAAGLRHARTLGTPLALVLADQEVGVPHGIEAMQIAIGPQERHVNRLKVDALGREDRGHARDPDQVAAGGVLNEK